MKVYLAGMFSTIATRKAQAAELRALGIEVTSRWIDETVPHNVSMKDVPDEYHRETSQADIQDILNADAFIMFVPSAMELIEAPVLNSSRGGRHFEMGFAYALNKPIFVCGPKENVFHHLPKGIYNFTDFEALKIGLESL